MRLTPAQMAVLDAMMRAGARGVDAVEIGRLAGLDPARDFRRGDWRGCNFGAHDLRAYSFADADVRGADFGQARGLRPEQFVRALWDAETVFPAGLRRRMKGWREPIPGLPEAAWPDMVTIPAGRFVMGAPAEEEDTSDNERPQREVTVARPFALGRCTVTFAQWDAAIAAGAGLHKPSDRGWGRGGRPVINVSWEDAQGYCAWLNRALGLPAGTYRLPTEAEWEYACRAGTVGPFSFDGPISTDRVNYDANFTYGGNVKGADREKTVAVGSLPANGWGLHEMHGNVWERVEDAFGSYPAQPTDSRALEHSGSDLRVLRGGSWIDVPRYCRSATRNSSTPDGRGIHVGCRLARTLS